MLNHRGLSLDDVEKMWKPWPGAYESFYAYLTDFCEKNPSENPIYVWEFYVLPRRHEPAFMDAMDVYVWKEDRWIWSGTGTFVKADAATYEKNMKWLSDNGCLLPE
jgi:hypothetical protein